jgi:DNA phosphorothioation-dependent restriction protein DptG
MEFAQLTLKSFIQVLHHQAEALEDGSFADGTADVIKDFHDHLVNLFLLVEAERIGEVFSLVQQAIFPSPLKVAHLDIFLQRVRTVHTI